jgi:hypothetical protein
MFLSIYGRAEQAARDRPALLLFHRVVISLLIRAHKGGYVRQSAKEEGTRRTMASNNCPRDGPVSKHIGN